MVKEILVGTSAGAAQQTYSLLQMSVASRVVSRMQTQADLANAEVVNMVKRLARKHHSAALAQLASRIAAHLRTYHTFGRRGVSRRHREGLLRRRDRENGDE